ncbi:Glycoside hydrolase family 76 protein [Mycena venus]|uniref:Glycoside hydrolase family 76 protein n=1 Tax=Mycena venus TaxID=2733690 RepID=A0A8H7CD82_9AGAR|nr:Glycoside hydrolase family 76 protein [Mycena venus]
MVAAAIGYSGWQGSNGIIGNGPSKSGDIILPRALSTVISRNAATPALQSYIEAYLSVQFNAVLDLATTSGSNIYAGSWNGPPSSSFSPGNQTNAIQALISAINFPSETSSTVSPDPVPSGSTDQPPTPSPRKTSKVGPIVGGTVGGLFLLAGGVLGVILVRRRTRNRRHSVVSIFSTVEVTPAINPFSVQSINSPPPSLPRPEKGDSFGHKSTSPQESINNSDELVSMASKLPTDELVALLYQRMHNVESAGGEHPPDYYASEIGH